MTKKQHASSATKTSTAACNAPAPRIPAPAATTAPVATAAASAAPSSRPPAPRPRPRTLPPPANTLDEPSRQDRIARAAYLRAEKAGFLTDPVENWLAAEREVDALRAP